MMSIDRFGCGVLILVVSVALGGSTALEETNGLPPVAVDTNRTGKYQRFANRVTKTGLNQNSCDTLSGNSGTCMTRFNCMRNGGTVSGFCLTYGVCCETNMLCGSTSNLKRTLIQTPASLTARCTYVFEPYSSRVCQIKIEMEEFRLQQPVVVTTAGSINDAAECSDRLEVNGLSICGNNDGQHVYVPFDGTDANINLNFILPTRDAVARWRLIVTQLECPTATVRKGLLPFAKTAGLQDLKNIFTSHNNDLTLLAPPGCTQFFTGRTGTFQSFNYNAGAGPYMAGLYYAICFQRLVTDSAIQFSFNDFELSQQGMNFGYDTDCHALIPTVGKPDDYLMIPGAMVTSATLGVDLHPTYFCGVQGPMVVSTAPGPFVIYFNSDEIYTTQDRGFQITYTIW